MLPQEQLIEAEQIHSICMRLIKAIVQSLLRERSEPAIRPNVKVRQAEMALSGPDMLDTVTQQSPKSISCRNGGKTSDAGEDNSRIRVCNGLGRLRYTKDHSVHGSSRSRITISDPSLRANLRNRSRHRALGDDGILTV